MRAREVHKRTAWINDPCEYMNVGVVRQLTLEPNIVDARGFVTVKKDKLDELKDANLFTPAELLSPLGASRDRSVVPVHGDMYVKLF